MQTIEFYRHAFLERLNTFNIHKKPSTLYDPIAYVVGLKGKRLRPALTLMTAAVFNQDFNKAMDAALAIEIFHNFSLVHDDIMDKAPLRRGHKTVHKKWNLNTAILSGDTMLILAYQLFESYEPATFLALAKLFSATAIQVCEGQQYDVDFETKNSVSQAQYLKMIEYKTAVLVGAAMQMGAIVAGTTIENQKRIYNFGLNLGIAFQLQDDYLDAFGDIAAFGKKIGGDILENKKTYLFIKALEFSSEAQKTTLLELFSNKNQQESKVAKVKAIFSASGAVEATKNEIQNYTQKAFSILDSISISNTKKQALKKFGNNLMTRTV